MNKITIRKIGPIEEVELDLNKVNVFIGPQSSGKSTIAKIISYCQWVEKRLILDGGYREDFADKFMEFHRVSESYFCDDSFIEYQSESVLIKYEGTAHNQIIEKINNGLNYKNSKNIYIPAERNFVSAIDNLRKYKRSNDNIMNFVYDWAEIRSNFPLDKKIPVLDLDVSYYYIPDSDTDMLLLDKDKKNIKLNNASSGLQSLIPLLLPLEFMTNDLFNIRHIESVEEKDEIAKMLNTIFFVYHLPDNKGSKKIETELKDKDDTISIEEKTQILISTLNNRKDYNFSQFILEEPEQNLFPETQRDLIYYIINRITTTGRDHKLLLTTHSPYVLYALNNCMMAGLVYDKMREQDKQKVKCAHSQINPKSVAIYQIDNGKIQCIQQPDGLIGNNYFDSKMKDLMDDFYVMLNYYGG